MLYNAFMTQSAPKNEFASYFAEPSNVLHKQYLALRRFFYDGRTAEQIAEEFGYSVGTVYSMVRDFKVKLHNGSGDPFFKINKVGRKPINRQGEIESLVVAFRKKYLSVPDIKIALDSLGFNVSEGLIYEIIHKSGFARLPRRTKVAKDETLSSATPTIVAPISEMITFREETFSSQLAGLLCFLPVIAHYGIHDIIQESSYPQTQAIDRLSSIMSFVALKLSNNKRYSADDTWCMDRGMGLFAGLNVLPKTAWFSSYSSAITRDTNIAFLKQLQALWDKNDLLSDTVNLDFTTIPYWGDDDPFENNWSGKRGKALASICAVIAQDPHHGILCYGDTTIRHKNQNDVVLEFLDFYHSDKKLNERLKYLVFDSKFTTYQNLSKLNEKSIKFITIRRRGKQLVERIKQISDKEWKKVKISKANGKGRTVTVYEETTSIKGYRGDIRQIYIKDNGKIKPAIIITNELEMPLAALVQKYGNRWLVEKEFAEHIDFFHLNRNSSGIVVKVDFDLTMSILAHNIYRLFTLDFAGYSHCDAQTIFDKFIDVQGSVYVSRDAVYVKLKRKRTLPLILEQMLIFEGASYPWLGGRKLLFVPDSTT
jgi:transposase/predicted transcriptional regulator